MKERLQTYHVLFLGDRDVGITSLIEHTPFDYEGEEGWGLGLEFYEQRVRTEKGPVQLIMFELGREDAFEKVALNFNRDCGVVLVYDVTRPKTLAAVLATFAKLRSHLPDMVPRILVANKADAPKTARKVDTKEGFEAASAIDAEYLETSVVEKGMENIHKVLEDIAGAIDAVDFAAGDEEE